MDNSTINYKLEKKHITKASGIFQPEVVALFVRRLGFYVYIFAAIGCGILVGYVLGDIGGYIGGALGFLLGMKLVSLFVELVSFKQGKPFKQKFKDAYGYGDYSLNYNDQLVSVRTPLKELKTLWKEITNVYTYKRLTVLAIDSGKDFIVVPKKELSFEKALEMINK